MVLWYSDVADSASVLVRFFDQIKGSSGTITPRKQHKRHMVYTRRLLVCCCPCLVRKHIHNNANNEEQGHPSDVCLWFFFCLVWRETSKLHTHPPDDKPFSHTRHHHCFRRQSWQNACRSVVEKETLHRGLEQNFIWSLLRGKTKQGKTGGWCHPNNSVWSYWSNMNKIREHQKRMICHFNDERFSLSFFLSLSPPMWQNTRKVRHWQLKNFYTKKNTHNLARGLFGGMLHKPCVPDTGQNPLGGNNHQKSREHHFWSIGYTSGSWSCMQLYLTKFVSQSMPKPTWGGSPKKKTPGTWWSLVLRWVGTSMTGNKTGKEWRIPSFPMTRITKNHSFFHKKSERIGFSFL